MTKHKPTSTLFSLADDITNMTAGDVFIDCDGKLYGPYKPTRFGRIAAAACFLQAHSENGAILRDSRMTPLLYEPPNHFKYI